MTIKTQVFPSVFSETESSQLMQWCIDNLVWTEGVRSRKGFTRLASSFQPGEYEIMDMTIAKAFSLCGMEGTTLLGIYVNLYRDGNDFTPNHSHPKQKQVVISLGETRTLTVGKKNYELCSGDVVVFGSSIHGIPKQPEKKCARISIATFSSIDK